MRTFIAFACCLFLIAPATAIAQKEKSCDASPRWLLVTVVAQKVWIKSDETDQLEPFQALTRTDEHLNLLDRCGVKVFSDYTIHQGSSKYPGDSDDNVATEITDHTQSNGKTTSLEILWVKESLQEICAAVRDCADATSKTVKD